MLGAASSTHALIEHLASCSSWEALSRFTIDHGLAWSASSKRGHRTRSRNGERFSSARSEGELDRLEERVGDDERPETAGTDVEEREHQPEHREGEECARPLVQMEGHSQRDAGIDRERHAEAPAQALDHI